MREKILAWAFSLPIFAAVLGSAITLTAALHQSSPVATKSSQDQVTNRPIVQSKDGYITSENCRDCHEDHYDSWHASFHRTMTQVPSDDNVLADFDNHEILRAGHRFRFYRNDGDFFMDVQPLNNGNANDANSSSLRTFKIVLMTGAHHQQAFWCETDSKRTVGKIPFIWINAEKRWVPYGSIFVIPSSGLSMHAGTWNRNCIKCHVVGGKPRLEQRVGFDTHVAEFGISCEACHGPGEAHVHLHEELELKAANGKPPTGNQKLTNPAKLAHQRSSQVCGQCHSIFEFYNDSDKQKYNVEGFAYRPGDELRDSRHVFQFHQDRQAPVVRRELKRNPKFFEQQFWSDGMVRVSGREYNGLLETACYKHGEMSCLSCHDMHPDSNQKEKLNEWADDQLKPNMRENRACIQCHQEYKSKEKVAQHTHHLPDSSGSLCYNCHMPHTTLGLMKAMRSHTVDSPNVATTLATGRPNACNLCHLDKTLKWTSQRLADWYKIEEPQLSQEESEIASSIRWILKGDAGQRAIAGWHLGWKPAQEVSGTKWMAPYLAELMTDTYDVVRFIGYHSLKTQPAFAEHEYDFVGSKESQFRGREDVLKIWKAWIDGPTPSKSLLIDEEGRLIEGAFQQLRGERLDPKVILIE